MHQTLGWYLLLLLHHLSIKWRYRNEKNPSCLRDILSVNCCYGR